MVCGQGGNLLEGQPSELVRVPVQVRQLVCTIGTVFTYAAIGRRGLSRKASSVASHKLIRVARLSLVFGLTLSVTVPAPKNFIVRSSSN